jgi:hypothetical protein
MAPTVEQSAGEVLLDAEATADEVAGVEAVLREAGIDWPCRPPTSAGVSATTRG